MKQNTKIFLSVLGIGGLVTASALIYRAQVPPSFDIYDIDLIKKSGTVKFGSAINSFDLNGGKGIAGYAGWGLTVHTPDGKTVVFDLYKNGTFVKTLDKV